MQEIKTIEYNHIRVLTTQQLAEAYEVEPRKITDNFNNNKSRYTEGKHYICLEGEDLKRFKSETENFGLVSPNARTFYLWLEKGCSIILLYLRKINLFFGGIFYGMKSNKNKKVLDFLSRKLYI